MDLFLTLRNFDAAGDEVMEDRPARHAVPVAKGWLRVSHRELDPELTLPYRPYHKHQRRLFLSPARSCKSTSRSGRRRWCSKDTASGSTCSRATASGVAALPHYHADYNTGTNTIYAGGEQESHPLLPVIPTN